MSLNRNSVTQLFFCLFAKNLRCLLKTRVMLSRWLAAFSFSHRLGLFQLISGVGTSPSGEGIGLCGKLGKRPWSVVVGRGGSPKGRALYGRPKIEPTDVSVFTAKRNVNPFTLHCYCIWQNNYERNKNIRGRGSCWMKVYQRDAWALRIELRDLLRLDLFFCDGCLSWSMTCLNLRPLVLLLRAQTLKKDKWRHL